MPFLPPNQQRQSTEGTGREGISGLEGLMAVVGLEMMTEGIRTGAGMER